MTDLNDDISSMLWTKVSTQLKGAGIDNTMMILKILIQTALSVPMLATNEILLKSHVNLLVQKLLEGADKIQGTEDDLITPETAAKIRVFLSDDNLDGLVHIVNAAVAGDLIAAGTAVAETASRCCLACFFPK